MIGAIVLWVAINIIGSIVEMSVPLTRYDTEIEKYDYQVLDEARKPEITDINITTMFSKVGDFFMTIGKFLSLWHPSLWQGNTVFVYYFIILPIGISFWVILVMALRGVGSS